MTLVEFVGVLERKNDRRAPVVRSLLMSLRYIMPEGFLGFAPPTGWAWFDALRAHARQNGSLIYDAPLKT